ncbi:type I polyketide synthase [Kibdelosporangium aridum]|uniref:Acyl transferase domain-containing protein n=1 Tax=Kibdelosporangium aridum TaxID=2030 RepID=A0A1W2FW33_KIBAR|nr:type I polyketide synthase [Kibdelosporangium aridum]SMD25846.1 Acyl transferase domain-containing protein [Kibdelosporangium aridum]
MNSVHSSSSEAESSAHEGIAVVGIGCRFPGHVSSADDLWRLLLDERDAVQAVPKDRWTGAAFYDHDASRPGHLRTQAGGYVDDVAAFDAHFFGIAPTEAARMDPQQRLFLETTWEALQDAGIVPELLAGTKTAVYAGVSGHDYGIIQLNPENRYLLGGHTMAGVTNCIVANRVSYLLDLRGPSMIVDTACSSSLVAIHLACRSIRSGEATMAIAGGVGALLIPETTIAFSQGTFLSPEGRSKSFSKSADGYVRSEGSGTVVLKPLSAAVADGDRIYAVIRGTATNSDGRTNGISVPSEEAQAQMILDACRDAGVAPTSIGYIEAHGTGTSVGDPIEARALGKALGSGRNGQGPCIVGAVKSNMGHLEPAAGIAGMIKACLVVSKGEIPANIHAEEPNPAIPFEELGLRLATARQPWPGDGPRLAGVNSFGFGGSNAHVILEGVAETDRDEETQAATHEQVLFTLSAKTKDALSAYVDSYADFLDEPRGAAALPAIASTQAQARPHYDHRLAIVGSSVDELRATLRDIQAGSSPDSVYSGVKASTAASVAFVFSGQGPQWWGMARELLDESEVFRQTVERVDAELGKYADWSVMEELRRDEASSRIGETFIAQPAVFAVQVGLASLWQSWGIAPSAVVGHSIGEVAAACVSGALSFEDAVRVIFHRSRVQQKASGKGKMLAVGLPPSEVESRIAAYRGRVEVAAHNGPESVALAGDPDALEEIERELGRDKIFCRMLQVSVAFHSHHMDPLKDELLASLAGITSGPSSIPMYSTVTADVVPTGALDAGYWWQNIRQPVMFAPTVDRLIEDQHLAFVELGPHPIHATAISELLEKRRAEGVVVASLHRKQSDRHTLLNSLASLYVAGYDPNWAGVFDGITGRVQVPFYPWQRETYWLETPTSRGRRFPSLNHPLVGTENRAADEPGKRVWELVLDPIRFPWLDDHRVQGPIVFPAAAYLDMVFGCAQDAFGDGPFSLEDVEFRRALFVFDDRPAPVVQVVLTQAMHFSVYSRQDSDAEWTLHSVGTLRRGAPTTALPKPISELQAECPVEIDPAELYAVLGRNGLALGPTFRAAVQFWRSDRKCLAQLETPAASADEAPRHAIHPGVLDSCITTLPVAYGDVLTGDVVNHQAKMLYLPVEVKRLSFHTRPSGRLFVYAQAHATDDPMFSSGDFWIVDEDGTIVAEFDGLKFKSITRSADDGDALANWFYDFRWHPAAVHRKTRMPADFLASDTTVQAAVEPLLDELRNWPVNRGYHAVTEAKMNRLCIDYVTEALHNLDMDLTEGRRFTLDEAAAEMGVHDKHRRYLGRLLELLAQHGIVENDTATWHVLRTPERVDTGSDLARLRREHPECESEYALLERCGKELATVLRDEVNPVELIFPEHEFQSVVDLYTTSFSFEKTNRIISEVVAQCMRSLPADRPVRVLEIGAGTGGTTGFVLSELPRDRAEYVYSDVGQLFLAKARERFAEYDFVDYRILDIEQDVEEQGFDPHYYDIVVASNVLHATPSLRATLANVQRLMTSQGMLLIMEATVPPHWVDLTFGMTEGWWKFDDHDVRPSYPVLTEAQWLDFLPTTGFEHVQVLSDKNTPEESGNSVIVARGQVVDLEPHQPRAQQGPWVVLADAEGVGERYLDLVGDAAAGSVLVTRGEAFEQVDARSFRVRPTSSEDLKRVLEQVRDHAGEVAGVLHLWNLDFAGSELSTELLPEIESQGAYSVVALVRAVEQVNWAKQPRFWVATSGAQVLDQAERVAPAQLPSWGIVRVLLNEQISLPAKIIDFDPATSNAGQRASQLLDELLHVRTADEEVAFRGDERFVDRLEHISPAEFEASVATPTRVSDETPFSLAVPSEHAIDQLRYEAKPLSELGRGEVAIRPLATGLNFRDVMLTLGMLAEGATFGGFYDDNLGVECAGVVTQVGADVEGLAPGDRVIAFARECFSNLVATDARLVFKSPSNLSDVEAATLPMAYLTAWYALVEVGRLRAGARVLIHAAAGGVGLAAVHIAQALGATVLATAGSEEKRGHLRSLGVEQVYDSRSLAFAEEIRQRYDGVDIVLNSLQGETIPKSLELLRPRGRFVEIGKKDIYENYQLGLKPFGNNLSYAAVDIDRLLLEDPALCRQVMTEVLDGVAAGTLPALPHTDFGAGDVAAAFRYMANAKQIGKVVVELAPDTELLVHRTSSGQETLDAEGTYLVTGGYTGFGLRTAQWLVEQSARTVVLVGRRAKTDAENEATIESMRAQGATVVLERADVSIEDEVKGLIERIAPLPPLKGIFHAAMVLDDVSLADMTEEQFLSAVRPKVDGAWHLHNHTRELDLDAFVMYSSMSWYIGTPGQANYSAANGFLEALAAYRRDMGLPALTVNWGAIGEVGFIARNKVDTLARMGWTAISPDQALAFVGRCLAQGVSRASVFGVNFAKMSQVMPSFRSSSRLAHLSMEGASGSGAGGTEGLRAELLELEEDAREPRLVAALSEQIARIFDMPVERLAHDVALTDLGMDSLMAGQIRNALAKHLEIDFPTMGLMRGPTVVELTKEVLGQVFDGAAGAQPESAMQAAGPERWIHTVQGRSNLASLRVFTLPFVGGAASVFAPWPDYLPDSVEVVALQAPGREDRINEVPIESMPEFIAELADAMLPYLDRSFAIYGHSMGGLLAYELTKYLEQQFAEVPTKLIIAGWPSAIHVEDYVRGLKHLRDGQIVGGESDDRVLEVLRDNGLLMGPIADENSIKPLMPAVRADLRMLGDYRFSDGVLLRAPITVLHGEEDPLFAEDQLRAWEKLTSGGFSMTTVPGGHLFIQNPSAEVMDTIARELSVKDTYPMFTNL